MKQVTPAEVDAIGLGAALLGSGGGGDLEFVRLMTRQTLERHGPVTLLRASELNPDGWVLPLYYMGAPGVAVEKPPTCVEFGNAIDLLERHRGIKFQALMVGEVVGANALAPIAEAAARGLPLVDADTMGRAFPAADMTLFAAAGISASPMTIADELGNCVLIEAAGNRMNETIGRAVVTAMGHFGGAAAYMATGRQVLEHAMLGSLSTCAEIGRCIQRIGEDGSATIEDLLALTQGTRLFSGKVVDVNSRNAEGLTKTVVTLEGLDGDRRIMRVDAQNENLVATEDGEVRAVTPDLICFLDSEVGTPVGTASVQFGMRLDVVALPCPDRWKTEAGLRLVGPRAHGYSLDYVEFAR